jgi:hypothetical protein
MTYFKDLTPYSYLPGRDGALNVGWLDRAYEFVHGDVSIRTLDKLRELASGSSTNQTRGYHVCAFCDETHSRPIVDWKGVRRILGSSEIWVTSRRGVTYAAPDMILHYIEAHHYLPPGEFLEAVDDLV